MSPRKTFTSCGSSSSFHFRRWRPTHVTRGSSALVKTGPGDFSLLTIVRNFIMWNSRPPRPGRFCRNSVLPLEVILTMRANTMSKGSNTNSRMPANAMSKARFQTELHQELRKYARPCCPSNPSSIVLVSFIRTSQECERFGAARRLKEAPRMSCFCGAPLLAKYLTNQNQRNLVLNVPGG